MHRNDHGHPVGEPVPGWQPRPPVEPFEATGRYVTLAPLTIDHRDEFADQLCAPEDDALWTYRFTERPGSRAEVERQLRDAITAAPTMAVIPVEGELRGRVAGVLTLSRCVPAQGQVEVSGILFARALQRTRAATEALHLSAVHVFDVLGYRRLEWKCDALNEPSRRAATRLGFGYEGRFRRHLVVKGRNRDTDWFAITDEDWPRLREAHREWLDPGNFDEAGRQRTSLRDLIARVAREPSGRTCG